MRSTSEPGAAAQLALGASVLVGGYFLAVDAGEYLRNFTAAVYGRFLPVRNELSPRSRATAILGLTMFITFIATQSILAWCGSRTRAAAYSLK